MKLNSKYTKLWIIWILAFGVIEYSAIKDKAKGDTLSENIRELIGTTGTRDALAWIFRLGVGGLILWAIPHFFTGSI